MDNDKFQEIVLKQFEQINTRMDKIESNQARMEYKLTDKGKDLTPVLKSMAAWGDKYYDGKA